MASHEDVLDLIRHLKQERLFVNAERDHLQRLNEQVVKTAERLSHAAWIGRRQYVNLDNFVSGSEDPHACQSLNAIEHANFIDAYKILNYHEQKCADFLRTLIDNPKLLSQCLIAADRQRVQLSGVIQTILGSLYGNCIMPNDERLVLKLLRDLIEQQVAVNENPLRLLRKCSCAFSKFYKVFCEGLFPAKLFLTAALHEPIMRLLMEDDWFYDLDPEKALVRFPPNERLVHFGQPNSKEYESNLKSYRQMTINKLVQFTERFILSIKKSMCCFPQSLTWIVQILYNSVTSAQKVHKSEAKALCAQLVFTFFICPAICDPEQYGITSDVCISYIARHNLMQVAQILQVLAVATAEEIDPKLRGLFARFDNDCMTCLLDAMLCSGNGDNPPRPHIQLQSVTRTAVLITMTDLRELVSFLQTCSAELPEPSNERKLLDSLLTSLPMSVLKSATPAGTPNHTPPGTPQSGVRKKILNTSGNRLKTAVTSITPITDENDDVISGETEIPPVEDVIVITVLENNGYPGMLSESKVLELSKRSQRSGSQDGDENMIQNGDDSLSVPVEPVLDGGEEVIEKRTRFSLSHDQDSIGNTSDNVELVSEACSSHSVGSEENDQDQENDNLSDMLSANVSGRGSPSISGRDTPLSQNEAEELEPEPPRRQAPDLPVTAQKPSRVDVTERFGRFEIRNDIERDEAKSTVSDTWSTDVFASDSEPPERDQLDRLEEVAEEMLPRQGLLGVSFAETTTEVSETASDAWSTDVLASDTDEKQSERLLELDQDDQLSISSKSQCTEDGRDGEFGEETPQASGVQSPADTSQELGAVGGLPSVFDASDHVICKKRSRSLRPDRFSEPVDRRVNNYGDTDFDRSTYPSFEDTSLMHMQRSADKAQRRRPDTQLAKRVVIAPLSPSEGGDYNFLNRPEPSSSSSSSNTSSHHRPERDSGISETPQDENREYTAANLGSLSEKLSKVNFKERSPDKEDLAMFDPLMTGSDSDNEKRGSELSDSINSTEGRMEASANDGKVEKLIELDPLPEDDVFEAASDGFVPTSLTLMTLPKSILTTSLHEERNGEKKRTSTSSIIRAFKDRWNKGTRKVTKGNEKDEGSWSNIPEKVPEPKQLIAVDRLPPADDRGEDILSKYRRKTRETSSPDHLSTPNRWEPSLDIPQYDPLNVEQCQAFHNAKRKLRLVFSTADFQTLPWSFSQSKRLSQLAWSNDESKAPKRENDLVSLLRMQLAEAINLQDKDLIAQLHETIRCVKMFDEDGTKKLLNSLKRDYRSRAPYVSYLVQCRQGLLATHAHLERLLQRIEKDKEVCNKYLVSMCVRRLLEKREGAIINLVPEFTKLTVADEKTDLLENFLERLYRRLASDPMWKGATNRQIEEGRLAVERSIMSRLYFHAMFPNADGDTLRDKILSQHIATLAETLTPDHPSLRIPKMYHSECPWPSAQAEIFLINAYKTPKDKITCVMNTSAIIMNLLSMSSERVPAADDFIPVLIYVIIKANPSNLLSTVQYINGLYEKRFSGEEQYWWMQFSSAVEFIKTM